MNSYEFIGIPKKSVSDLQYQYWKIIIAIAVAWQSTNIKPIVYTKNMYVETFAYTYTCTVVVVHSYCCCYRHCYSYGYTYC